MGEELALEEAEFNNQVPRRTEYIPEIAPNSSIGLNRMDQLSLYIHRAILEKSFPENIKEVIEDLLITHENTRGIGGQDYGMYVLIKALQMLGRTKQADEFLFDYINHYRIERWPPQGKLKIELQQANIRLKKGRERSELADQKPEYDESSVNL